MISTEFVSLAVAGLGVVGVTMTAVLSGAFQRSTVQAQIVKELHVLEINTRLAQEKVVREKFEEFFAEITVLNGGTVDLGDKESRNAAFTNCRRAAYALLAHAGPELAGTAVNMVEVLDKALSPTSTEKLESLRREVTEVTATVTASFMREVAAHRKAQSEAFHGALGGA